MNWQLCLQISQEASASAPKSPWAGKNCLSAVMKGVPDFPMTSSKGQGSPHSTGNQPLNTSFGVGVALPQIFATALSAAPPWCLSLHVGILLRNLTILGQNGLAKRPLRLSDCRHDSVRMSIHPPNLKREREGVGVRTQSSSSSLPHRRENWWPQFPLSRGMSTSQNSNSKL